MPDAKAEEILKRLERKQSRRSMWDTFWQELLELCRPNTLDFNRTSTPGEQRTDRIFDGTALKASEELAAGLAARVSPSTARWFMVTHPDWRLLEDDDVLNWLEDVSDIMYMHYSMPDVSTHLSLNENYLDLGVFGTCVLFQDKDFRSRTPVLRAFPLSSCWCEENAGHRIDSVDHLEMMDTRQAIQMFGDSLPAKILECKELDKPWTFIHSVYPRSDYNRNSYSSKEMPWASCWVNKEERATVRESGYKENPFHVARWTKTAGEVYGRAPAMNCLPDIRMVNAMSKTVLRAAQKIVDPPIICDDDGVLLPLKTSPGGVILKTPGADAPVPLQTGGRVDIGLDMMDQRRDFIMRCFFVDYIRRTEKKERQSQLEIADVRDEMDRQMNSIVGRIQTELHNPMLRRTFNMLLEAGMFPEPPRALMEDGRKLEIAFISPSARAQLSSKILSLQQAMNDIAVFAGVNPSILDVVDVDKAAQQIFLLRDVSRKVIRTPQEIAQIREQRAAVQQISAAAETGATAAAGVRDLAAAQADIAKANGQA